MSKADQKDPEVVLQDVITEMLDTRKYRSYTNPEEWKPFFTAMNLIVKQICKKQTRLEKESSSFKDKFEMT